MRAFEQLNLKAADRIVVPKSNFRVVQHHVIFLGYLWGNYWIAENRIGKGVCICKADEFFEIEKEITRIERFIGTDAERSAAVTTALSLRGKEYNLLNFNCEHYSNLVQHTKSDSPQLAKAFFFGVIGLSVWMLAKE